MRRIDRARSQNAATQAGLRRACSPPGGHLSVGADLPHGRIRVTRRSEPIFNVPAVVIAVIAACVFVHLARVYLLSDEEDIDFLVTFAFIPARYSSASVL